MQVLLLAITFVLGAAPTVRVPVKAVTLSAVPRLTLASVNFHLPAGGALTNPQPILTVVPQPVMKLAPAAQELNESDSGPNILSNLTASVEKLEKQPEAELNKSFDGVVRSLSGHTYVAFEPGYEARFRLESGVLKASIKTRGEKGRAQGIYAKNEFASALKIFKTGVRAVEGNWTQGDNLREFNVLTKAGLSSEQAALGTWTGRQAVKAGYTKVIVLPAGRWMLKHQQPGEYTAMSVLFVKPEDHHLDRKGEAWRRTKNRNGWERWEKDGKVVQVLTRGDSDGISYWEWHQDGKIPPGAAPAAYAHYSWKEGKLWQHVVTEDSVILNAKKLLQEQLAKPGFDGLHDVWIFGDNLAEFNRLTAQGLRPEEAAFGTWTGKLAAKAGFTSVVFGENTKRNLRDQKPGQYTGVTARFLRP